VWVKETDKQSFDGTYDDHYDVMVSKGLPKVRCVRPLHMTLTVRSSLRVFRTMKVIPVPVRNENYAYLLIDEPTKKAAAVDPYDVAKVVEAAETHGVQIVAGITTHHHFDHSGGNQVRFLMPSCELPH
jgi:hypothetical protein